MDNLKEEGNIIIGGHILIRDKISGEVLLNKSESSLKDKTINKKKDDQHNAG